MLQRWWKQWVLKQWKKLEEAFNRRLSYDLFNVKVADFDVIPVIDEKSPSVVAKTFELNEMRWNIIFSKINKNLQQFHITSKNKTQGNL